MSPDKNNPTANDDWKAWSNYVLLELKRLGECGKDINGKLSNMTIEITKLKVKAGIWGLAGGAIPVVVMLAIYFLNKM